MSERVRTASSTPVSILDPSDPAAAARDTKAPKDKECPFCHTPYTASSLGRHLDTFIKSKNPKPSDGIHDVVKIREMRQTITRRQMREKINGKRTSSTSQGRNVSGDTSKRTSTGDGDEDEDMEDDESPTSPLTRAPSQKLNTTETGDKMRWKINELDWHSTGVMPNIPPPEPIIAPEPRRSVSRQKKLKSGFESRSRHSEEMHTARATDMALKEVLSRVKEASARSVQSGVFDFDPYELNFPALCLRILPSPPTLRSPTPFPTNESWSLSPPGQRQWESLQRAVKEKLLGYHRAWSGSSGSSPLATPPTSDVDLNRLKHHLHDAYTHWQSLSETQRQETWQLEILRSFSNAEEGRKDLQNKLDVTIRENEDLRRELEAMRHTLEDDGVDRGREISRVPPVPSISPKTVQEIWKLGFDVRQWDYESLIQKWKAAMREEKQSSNGMAAQRKLSATPTTPAVKVTPKLDRPKSRTTSVRDEAMQSAAGVNTSQRSASRSRSKKRSDRVVMDTEMADHEQDGGKKHDARSSAVEFQNPRFQPVQEPPVPPPPQRSPRPPTPQKNTHLSAAATYHNQRRSSAQLSPHAMPSQQRRHSAQYQFSPQPPPSQQHGEQILRSATQMMQFSQAPLLHIQQTAAEQQPVQSSFQTQPLQQPTMQGWMHHHQHQQAPSQPHRQSHDPVQALTPVSVSIADQAQFHQQPITDSQFQSLGLQVPPSDGRRNSHPMIDPSQHVEMQGVEAPASAGGYMNARMPLHMEALPLGYVGTGMGLVSSAGGRVG